MLPYVALKIQEVHNGPKLLTYEANTLEVDVTFIKLEVVEEHLFNKAVVHRKSLFKGCGGHTKQWNGLV